MLLDKMETVLSTHKIGGPKKSFLLHSILHYFVIAVILIVSGIILFNQLNIQDLRSDLEILRFIPIMLIIFGVIVLVLGILNIQRHETIKLDNSGITIIKGKKTKYAMWSDIIKINNGFTYRAGAGLSHGATIRQYPHILIITNEWKHKLVFGNFNYNELKNLFINLAEYGQGKNLDIIDGLDWLPDSMEFAKNKNAGQSVRTREYKILLKIGLWMLFMGFLMMIVVFFLNLFKSPWFAAMFLSLFFGFMLAIAGWCGLSEEKQKLEKNKTV